MFCFSIWFEGMHLLPFKESSAAECYCCCTTKQSFYRICKRYFFRVFSSCVLFFSALVKFINHIVVFIDTVLFFCPSVGIKHTQLSSVVRIALKLNFYGNVKQSNCTPIDLGVQMKLMDRHDRSLRSKSSQFKTLFVSTYINPVCVCVYVQNHVYYWLLIEHSIKLCQSPKGYQHNYRNHNLEFVMLLIKTHRIRGSHSPCLSKTNAALNYYNFHVHIAPAMYA